MFSYDYVKLRSSEQIGLHSQNSWELSFVIKGHGERCIGDKTMGFAEQDVALVIPNMPHKWSFESQDDEIIENITVCFDDSFLSNCFSHTHELECVKDYYINLSESIVLVGNLRDEVSKSLYVMRSMTDTERVITLMQILCQISQERKTITAGKFIHKETREEKLNRAKIYARCNYKKQLQIKDVAEHVGMSETSFCNFWKQMTGSKFFDFLIGHRIEVACNILQNPHNTVSDACFESGFNDLAYFSKTFKRIKGMSPSKYRMLVASDHDKEKKDDR